MYNKLLLMLCLSLAPGCFAALEGIPVEGSSESNIRISLDIVPSLQISVVDEINIDIIQTNIDASFQENLCVTGHEDSRYDLIASGGDGNFLLRNALGGVLPYSVFYKGAKDSTEYDELGAGIPSPTYELLPFTDQCTSGHNFRVTFRKGDLQTAESGLYTGHLTLLVSPE